MITSPMIPQHRRIGLVRFPLRELVLTPNLYAPMIALMAPQDVFIDVASNQVAYLVWDSSLGLVESGAPIPEYSVAFAGRRPVYTPIS